MSLQYLKTLNLSIIEQETRSTETLFTPRPCMKTYTVVCGWDEGLSFIRTGLCLPPRFPGNFSAAADIRRWLASLANHSGRWVVGTPGPAADNP